MCSLQRLALSILLLGASLRLSASWRHRLTRTTVCQELHVTHPGQNLELTRGNVSLVLLKSGKEVSCYEPDQEYEVELRSNYKKMMGVLWVLDPVAGEFPLGPAPRNTKKNSVCNSPHISHYCEDQSEGAPACILGENGMSLKVGYRAPSLNDLHTMVVFRYTVVFKEHEYLMNEKQHFERCSATTTNAPEPTAATSKPKSPCSDESTEDNGSQVKPEDNNLTSLDGVEINLTNNKPKSSQGQCNTFKPQEDATAASGHCGIKRVRSNESRPYTDPETNIPYICTIMDEKQYVRKVTCDSRCQKNGQEHICRVKRSVERKRDFLCRPDPNSDYADFGNVYREFVVEQQSQCECFPLSDVELTCPTTSPPVRCPTATRGTTTTTPSPATTTQSNRPY